MTKRNPRVYGYTLAAVLLLPLTSLHADSGAAQSAAAAVQRKPSSATVTRFSADVSIQRGFLDQDGRPAGATIPAIHYRWEPIREDGRWKTVMTLTPATRRRR
jgi:hypothetical protein